MTTTLSRPPRLSRLRRTALTAATLALAVPLLPAHADGPGTGADTTTSTAGGRPYESLGELEVFPTGLELALAVTARDRLVVARPNPGSRPGSKVRVFSLGGRLLDTWDVPVDSIGGIDVDGSGNVHVGDGSTVEGVRAAVHVFSSTGRALGTYGRDDSASAAIADVAVAPDGTRWTVDPVADLLSRYSPDGTYVASTGGPGTGPGQLDTPVSVDVDASGDVYVADRGNNRVQVFSPGGRFLRTFGVAGTDRGRLTAPHAIQVAPHGNVFVVDEPESTRVQEFSPGGRFLRLVVPEGARRTRDLGLDRSGRLYVDGPFDEQGRGRVEVFTPVPRRVALSSRRLDVSSGKVSTRVRCLRVGSCVGRLEVRERLASTGGDATGRVLAAGSFRIARGATGTSTMTLTPTGRDTLREQGWLEVRLTATTPAAPATRVDVTMTP